MRVTQDTTNVEELLAQQTRELQASQARFRNIITRNADGIVVIDLNGIVHYANPAAEMLLGRSEQELVGNNFGFPAVSGEITELDILRKDGKVAIAEMYIVETEWEGQPAFLANLRDITTRKKMEESLIYRARYEELIANISSQFMNLAPEEIAAGIWQALRAVGEFCGADAGSITLLRQDGTCDGFYRWQHMSVQADADHQTISPDIYAWLKDQLAAQPTLQIQKVDDLPAEATVLRRLLEEQSIQSVLSTAMFQETSLMGFIGCSSKRVCKAWPENTLGLLKTVGEIIMNAVLRKRAKEEILALNADLEQRVQERTLQLEVANKELEAFSYSVSHDLRAPLRAIEGFSRILSDEYADQLGSDAAHYIHVVCDNAQQMSNLIEALLKFSRLTRQALNKQPINFKTMVQEILDGMQSDYEKRQVEFVVHDMPDGAADPTLIKQVWVNLLSNALKFTLKREQAKIEVGAISVDGELAYFVSDNGAGFDMQYASRLFGVFQRLHRVEEFAGTGVGLALVQRIIHRHGGRIWTHAEVDRGATFYFTLPT